jgi:hypothetical protein
MVERNGQTFCCNNCAMAASGMGQQRSSSAVCAHCQTPIFDESTQVERGGQSFCCNNCATAMAQGSGHRMGGRSS